MPATAPSCPRCSSVQTLPIVYGLPAPATFERAQRGELVIGGCIVSEGAPTWHCAACGHRFRELSLDD